MIEHHETSGPHQQVGEERDKQGSERQAMLSFDEEGHESRRAEHHDRIALRKPEGVGEDRHSTTAHRHGRKKRQKARPGGPVEKDGRDHKPAPLPDVSRRQFLKGSTVTVAAVGLGGGLRAAQDEAPAKPQVARVGPGPAAITLTVNGTMPGVMRRASVVLCCSTRLHFTCLAT